MLTFVIPSKVCSTLQISSLVQTLSCEGSQPFTLLPLLYFSDPSNIQSSPPPSVTCPEGYTAFWYVCLKLVLTSTVSWADAESACQAEEANLVSIHNDAENSAVLLALEQSGNQPFWIGLHDPQVKILRRLYMWKVLYIYLMVNLKTLIHEINWSFFFSKVVITSGMMDGMPIIQFWNLEQWMVDVEWLEIPGWQRIVKVYMDTCADILKV